MTATVRWEGTLTALSSIAHGGETRGITTLLTREKIVQPDGRILHVPVISGNSWRGKLRRIAEELMRDVLDYDGAITLAAAHALRGGGALAKTGSAPLSGERLRTVRTLLPLIGVFGTAASGTIIDGCLQVGKLLPHCLETAHLLPGRTPDQPPLHPLVSLTQIETYSRQDDAAARDFPRIEPTPLGEDGDVDLDNDDTAAERDSALMRYRMETYPAGTAFDAWLAVTSATPHELQFLVDVLAAWEQQPHLGGRIRAGHGLVKTELTPRVLRGRAEVADWRAFLRAHRTDALHALQWLT